MSVRSVSKTKRSRLCFSKILVASVLAGGAFLGCLHAADSDNGDSISQEVQKVFARSQNAVVKIEAVDEHGHLCGSGFFIDPNGTIYTTYTVGGESHDIVVSQGETKYVATRLLGDPRSGIAILKVEAGTPFLPFAKAGDLTVATPVLSIGYPKDQPATPSLGVVAGLDARDHIGYFLTTHIRASLPVQRGQGGAPLLNLKGEVVGIIISGCDDGTACYALPIDAAEKVRTDYVRFGEVHHGWIGINVVQSGTITGGSTVVVNSLLENTPAALSGLKNGDVLIQVGDKKIVAPEDVLNASFFLTAGDDVPLTVLRGGEKITVKVQPIPDDPEVSLHAGAPTPPPVSGGIPLRMTR
jgi:serine protease Do